MSRHLPFHAIEMWTLDWALSYGKRSIVHHGADSWNSVFRAEDDGDGPRLKFEGRITSIMFVFQEPCRLFFLPYREKIAHAFRPCMLFNCEWMTVDS